MMYAKALPSCEDRMSAVRPRESTTWVGMGPQTAADAQDTRFVASPQIELPRVVDKANCVIGIPTLTVRDTKVAPTHPLSPK
jgi:hypothetical protein